MNLWQSLKHLNKKNGFKNKVFLNPDSETDVLNGEVDVGVAEEVVNVSEFDEVEVVLVF